RLSYQGIEAEGRGGGGNFLPTAGALVLRYNRCMNQFSSPKAFADWWIAQEQRALMDMSVFGTTVVACLFVFSLLFMDFPEPEIAFCAGVAITAAGAAWFAGLRDA